MSDPSPYVPESSGSHESSGADRAARWTAALLRLGTLGELGALLLRGGRWWMLPLVLGLGGLLIAALLVQALHHLAPFFYVAL